MAEGQCGRYCVRGSVFPSRCSGSIAIGPTVKPDPGVVDFGDSLDRQRSRADRDSLLSTKNSQLVDNEPIR